MALECNIYVYNCQKEKGKRMWDGGRTGKVVSNYERYNLVRRLLKELIDGALRM